MASPNPNLDVLKNKSYFGLLRDFVSYFSEHNYKVGDKLPREETLAYELHTNRSTLRENLRILEFMGIIDSQRGSGNVYTGNLEVGLMNILVFSNALDNAKGTDFSSMRAAFESIAVREFVDCATDADIYRLEIICEDKLEQISDKHSAEYLSAHIEFHTLLMKYYPNETARQIVCACLRTNYQDFESNYDCRYSKTEMSSEDKAAFKQFNEYNSHQAIIAAIKSRDKNLATELVIRHCFVSPVKDI